jgi:hypothetical protein
LGRDAEGLMVAVGAALEGGVRYVPCDSEGDEISQEIMELG